jgi:hypothetical protein
MRSGLCRANSDLPGFSSGGRGLFESGTSCQILCQKLGYRIEEPPEGSRLGQVLEDCWSGRRGAIPCPARQRM